MTAENKDGDGASTLKDIVFHALCHIPPAEDGERIFHITTMSRAIAETIRPKPKTVEQTIRNFGELCAQLTIDEVRERNLEGKGWYRVVPDPQNYSPPGFDGRSGNRPTSGEVRGGVHRHSGGGREG